MNENPAPAAAQPNIAETLARVLPTAKIVYPPSPTQGDLIHVAVPKNFEMKEIDTEKLLGMPRRTKGTADFADAASFLAYIERHKIAASTVAWCNFDPQTFALSFTAVIDDHAAGALAGWRSHKATFKPEMSAEWKAWKGSDRTVFSQVQFAEWIQEHDTDITTANGLPTSLQMLTMATEFVANEEHALKSAVKMQSGGVRLTYIADADKGTTEDMKVFERFALGIPVFHGGAAWSMTARLKYRNSAGKVSFFYELVRPDRVHQGAADELIAKVREGLNGVPLLMGSLA
jgi:uncharacterized protein YfdQ (DUF2303 family)